MQTVFFKAAVNIVFYFIVVVDDDSHVQRIVLAT